MSHLKDIQIIEIVVARRCDLEKSLFYFVLE